MVSVSNQGANSAHTVLSVGGFGGGLGGISQNEGRVWIKDSYARGNVSVDYTGGPTGTAASPDTICAGGFLGNVDLYSTGYWIERCFSTGSVSAAASAASNTSLYAGGFAGYKGIGILRSCAALGGAVTVKGSAAITRELGRICGSSAPANLSNNFASASMQLERDVYGALNPAPVAPVPDIAGKDGQSASTNDLRKIDFWLDTAGLAFNLDGSGTGFGSIVNIWDFSSLAGRGYPLLVGLPAQ